MRWFINRNGETGGPYSEREVRGWVAARQVGPEASVRAEFDPVPDRWTQLDESGFERFLPRELRAPARVRAERRKNALLVGVPMALVAACGALVFTSNRPVYDPDAGKGAVPAVAPPPAIKCVLSIPGSGDRVPVFPTEAGMDEFGAAAVSGDDQAIRVALVSNGAVMVESGTKCTWLDVGIMRTRVRVVDGAHSGAAGWVPSEWARGR